MTTPIVIIRCQFQQSGGSEATPAGSAFRSAAGHRRGIMPGISQIVGAIYRALRTRLTPLVYLRQKPASSFVQRFKSFFVSVAHEQQRSEGDAVCREIGFPSSGKDLPRR